MTCMDIIKQLEPKDRAECWQLFTKLSRVFMIEKTMDSGAVSDLRSSAQKMNDIFVKNGFEPYFNIELDNESFIDRLVSEMIEIKNGNKLKD